MPRVHAWIRVDRLGDTKVSMGPDTGTLELRPFDEDAETYSLALQPGMMVLVRSDTIVARCFGVRRLSAGQRMDGAVKQEASGGTPAPFAAPLDPPARRAFEPLLSVEPPGRPGRIGVARRIVTIAPARLKPCQALLA